MTVRSFAFYPLCSGRSRAEDAAEFGGRNGPPSLSPRNLISPHLKRKILPTFKWRSKINRTTKRAMEASMDYCPLVQLARNRKLLKKFEETGRVTMPLTDWARFFEALAFMNREGSAREIYCAITGE